MQVQTEEPVQIPETLPEPTPAPAPEPVSEPEPAPEPTPEPEIVSDPDFSTGTPWLFSNLAGAVTADTPTDLKDDFGLYANKELFVKTELAGSSSITGTLYDISPQVQKDLVNMFRGKRPDNHDARLAYDAFQLCLDWKSRNARGVEPLRERTDRLEAIHSLSDMSAYFLEVPSWDRAAYLWTWQTGANYQDSRFTNINILDDDSRVIGETKMLMLGDSSRYTGASAAEDPRWKARAELIKKLLLRLDYSEAEADRTLENCFAFETMLAGVIPDRLRKYEMYITLDYDSFTREELLKAEGDLPVLEELEHIGVPPQDTYVVPFSGMLEKLAALYTEENVPLMRGYLIAHEVYSAAWQLDRTAYDWFQECEMAEKGYSVKPWEESFFAGQVDSALPWPTARLYTDTYMNKKDKERITEFVEEIREAYRGMLMEADFLSDATREKALEKLDVMGALVLYPDDWEHYDCSELDIPSPREGGKLWEALNAANAKKTAMKLDQLNRPRDREEWLITPQFANCCYNPNTNCIQINGAFTRGGFYSSGMSKEEQLGMIGLVIAHEISHSFDSGGGQYDALGNVTDWWTPEDKAAFQVRVDRMAAYFKAIHPWQGANLPGDILTVEACADMAGLKCLLRVAAETEDFDYDAFFRAFAKTWFAEMNTERAKYSLGDSHPLPFLRINCTLQQYDEFLDFYGIEEGDGMYLAPEDRVAIW
ncbi:MAG: M13 family metallopeptidase [Oscillospiraceae bacterium]|nr:M13 family metallopeptidase [Oscillospiraceae bacterium]